MRVSRVRNTRAVTEVAEADADLRMFAGPDGTGAVILFTEPVAGYTHGFR